MNLWYKPSIDHLKELIDNAVPSFKEHNIALDYDGEVIIDPEIHYPHVPIHRFKFHTQIGHMAGKRKANLKMLFAELVRAFDPDGNNTTGLKIAA
jgi:hypothetical protein